ncbi:MULTISPECIES: YerC/YecD family TrpR-related protein [Listeria]|uniref:YerC/YecD family TrpR-related protein n=1 Tax=Listeria TaxID=1637 RepID=UPI000C076442|nr:MULTISPECIES: YerC/YecD family TrpR-related protein [Listeria]
MQIEKLRGEGLDAFFEGILTLETLEECYAFFDDVCTVNEIQSMSQRFQVAKMLAEGKTYSVIEVETGASTATISRVKRSLNYGNDMYQVVFDRMKEEN